MPRGDSRSPRKSYVSASAARDKARAKRIRKGVTLPPYKPTKGPLTKKWTGATNKYGTKVMGYARGGRVTTPRRRSSVKGRGK